MDAGIFITFEGPEGSGKTTQIHYLTTALTEAGYKVISTREPGGTDIGNQIRALLLDTTRTDMTYRAEALLFNAARAQLVDQVIRPALAAGHVVLCDRYADSTLAYQGYGRAQPLDPLRYLADYATAQLQPTLTIYMDIDPAQGLVRKQTDANEEWNRMEEEALDFHRTVHRGYLKLAAEDPVRWLVIEAAKPEKSIHQQILTHVMEKCL